MSATIEAQEELEKQEGQPPAPQVGMNELAAMLKKIHDMLANILSQKGPEEEMKATEAPVKPMLQPENLTKFVQEEVQKAMHSLSPETIISLAKAKGLAVTTTPTPNVGTTADQRPPLPAEIKKQADKPQPYSEEELLDFMGQSDGAQQIYDRIKEKTK